MSAPTRIRGLRCTDCGSWFKTWGGWKDHECVSDDDTMPDGGRRVPA